MLAKARKMRTPNFCEHVPVEMLSNLQAIIDALSAPQFSESAVCLTASRVPWRSLKLSSTFDGTVIVPHPNKDLGKGLILAILK